jgi:5-methylcytosine-specific restriction protein A
MASISQLTDKRAVLAAIAECGRLGRGAFLRQYGFGQAKTWVLVHEGLQYDSKAIVGVAIGKQHGKALRATDFKGGEASAVRKLRSLGFLVVPREITDRTVRLPEEVPENFPEGLVRQILVDRVERSPEARARCIELHGHRCAACGMDFAEIYGAEFEGLIHVHHLHPVSRAKGHARHVDPRRDLRPVCPNCHAAIHWAGKTRAIKTIAALIVRVREAAV